MAVFDAVLEGRLIRRLPTVIDSTNTETDRRTDLVDRARRHGLPPVAIIVRTSLATCLARQQQRPANRAVPAWAVIRQHLGIPTTSQLLSEGFAEVHDAAELDLLHSLLHRAAHNCDPYAGVRHAFGELADVFTRNPDPDAPHTIRGHFAIAGHELAIRWHSDGDPYDHGWQARIDDQRCEDCGATLWATVHDALDLLDAYTGKIPDEAVCITCDTTASAD